MEDVFLAWNKALCMILYIGRGLRWRAICVAEEFSLAACKVRDGDFIYITVCSLNDMWNMALERTHFTREWMSCMSVLLEARIVVS